MRPPLFVFRRVSACEQDLSANQIDGCLTGWARNPLDGRWLYVSICPRGLTQQVWRQASIDGSLHRGGEIVITIFVTGGIGSGKSTLMRFFEEKGAGVVYADEVGHENLHDEAMKAELREAFGPKIFDEQGEVVRSVLAARAFSSAENTALLDSITQPRLYEGCLRHLSELGETHEVVVLEMAILDGRDDFYKKADIVIAVTTSPEVRVARLMQSRGFTEQDARNRLANQVPEEQRLAIADVVFANDGTLEEFEAQISNWWNSAIEPRLSK